MKMLLLIGTNQIRRFHPDVFWADEVIKLNLESRLFELLNEAVKLGEDDKSIISGTQYRLEQANSRLENAGAGARSQLDIGVRKY